eukprot:Tamp_10759.p1 GENE.Tamp_10759~~Tamp_10759.p1  ORF type:complete len:486 (+),score=115.82 Tamp_10759:111-1568(+)
MDRRANRRGMGCSLVFVAVVASVLQVMGEGRSSEEVSIARENVIIPSPRVAYHVGDESLDAVCTSLDGPLCKAEEKAHMLSMERARAARTAGHQQSEQKRGRNAGAKETVQVKTVKEFKFQGGKEVGGKVETQVKKGGGKERDSPLVILKQFAEGDDINDIVNQVQAGIADALKALEEGLDGDEDPGDEVSSQLRQLRQRGSDDEHRTTARRRLKDVRECDVPVVVDGAAGNHKSVPTRGHVGGSGAAPGVCRHKDALYRCTKIEGNALAPDAQQAAGRAGDSSASGSGGGGKEGGSGASGGCLTRQESAGECGGGEVLCQVSSPSSLAEFSSPQPCSFHYKPGFVPDDPRQDILIADMTWAQAKDWCDNNEECVAFTFASAAEKPVKPVTVWFKRISYVDRNGRGWHTFIKKCSRPSVGRFSYLDNLPAPVLQWLLEELVQQFAYAQNLLSTRLPNEKMEDADGAMGSRQSAESLPIINLPKDK